MRNKRICWCGTSELIEFSENYSKCAHCGTLISQNSLSDEELVVKDDETDFYGKQYWIGHQKDDLGFPDIYERSRNDLTERNLHWLSTLLKYKLPPTQVLELGCSHGSFVALLTKAGYLASGVEMSPWVVAYGRETFDIQMDLGPVEDLNIPEGSLDVIALMDVLEHLPNPASTLEHCLRLLKQDGIFFIQTPQFEECHTYEHMVDTQSPFLEQLKADEHLYLFTKESVLALFKKIGAENVAFEQAIFSHYDMSLIVSRNPLVTYDSHEQEQALLKSPEARFVLALLDIRERELNLSEKLKESEADRKARLEQIYTLTDQLKESEADREARRWFPKG